ncbi:DedA family protein [Jannaschia formosa]|uniref:DedA family protein n=1 Tax=Jannaschia formosa TaxID=2259592 RepID=UPI000E1B9596|nr:DedA family protein [Jannaschia formosa]TFL18420.1 DedA family protein [Jannaschia formosa]
MFDVIVSVMDAGGTFGVAVLMFLENVFPPIPSELVMPLAGFTAARGDMTLGGAILAGTAGSVAGALLWYWIGLKVGEKRLYRLVERYGHWLTVDEDDIGRSTAWFRRHGEWAVFLGRMVPGIRTFISIPAGLAGMKMTPFLIYTTLGSVLWTAVLAGLGYLLESQYDRVAAWLDPVTWLIIAAVVGAYLWRLSQGKGRKARPDS